MNDDLFEWMKNMSVNRELEHVSNLWMYSRTNSFKYSYFIRILIEWNSLPNDIKNLLVFLVLSTELYHFLVIVIYFEQYFVCLRNVSTGMTPSCCNSWLWFHTRMRSSLIFFLDSFLYILNFGYFRFRYDLYYILLHITLWFSEEHPTHGA